MGHVLVGVEAEVRSLEEVEAALQIAGDERGFREMKLLVRIQDGDVDGREPRTRGLLAAFETVDEREQLPRVRPAVEEPPQRRGVALRLVEPPGDRAGVAPDPVRNKAVRINVEPALSR